MASAPTCYRHPDRETYIRCTRCDRSICPDCMTPAPVGFQCPECVREGRASIAQVRTPYGGKVSERPYVTQALIAACVIVFLLEYVGGGPGQAAVRFGNVPAAVAINGDWWRMVTSGFLHTSILHIAFNMYALYLLGPTLERLLGHLRFSALYGLSLLGGSVASYFFSPVAGVSIGASGAIFGLMGAFVIVGRQVGVQLNAIVGLIVINLILGFVIPNIDWRAHLGGLVTGSLVSAIFVLTPRGRSRNVIHLLGCLAVLAVLVALTYWHAPAVREAYLLLFQSA